jgi:hypothetical protein
MKRRRRNISDWPVMKQKCATCPFGPNGDPRVHESVVERVTQFKGQQQCHHPSLQGRPETHLCRGARDLLLNVLTAMGAIEAPTDKAFIEKWEEIKNANEQHERHRAT